MNARFGSASLAITNPVGLVLLLFYLRWSAISNSRIYAVLLPGAAHISKTEWCALTSSSKGGIILTISYLVIKPQSPS